MRSGNFKILLFFGSLFVALFVAELLLRVFWLPRQGTPARIACEYDSLLGWKKIGGRSVNIRTSEYSLRETLNSKGLRGPDYPYERDTSSLRVLALGDSFVEGYSVPDIGLFSVLLENMLQLQSSSAVEIINMGTGGYSTDQEYLAYGSEGRKYRPDLVLLFFYYNDLLYNIKSSYDGYPKPYFSIVGRKLRLGNVPVPKTGLHGQLRTYLKSIALLKLVSSLKYQLRHKKAAGSANIETDVFLPTPPLWVDKAWEVTEGILIALSEAAKRDGGKLIVLYVPARFEIVALKKSEEFARRMEPKLVSTTLKKVCLRNGMEFVDLKDAFRQSSDVGPVYYPIDGHWNPRGHLRVAQFLSRVLQSYNQD